jgi:hypothetical protein
MADIELQQMADDMIRPARCKTCCAVGYVAFCNTADKSHPRKEKETTIFQVLLKKKRTPFIFNDESTGSCICLRLDLYMSYVKEI